MRLCEPLPRELLVGVESGAAATARMPADGTALDAPPSKCPTRDHPGCRLHSRVMGDTGLMGNPEKIADGIRTHAAD